MKTAEENSFITIALLWLIGLGTLLYSNILTWPDLFKCILLVSILLELHLIRKNLEDKQNGKDVGN